MFIPAWNGNCMILSRKSVNGVRAGIQAAKGNSKMYSQAARPATYLQTQTIKGIRKWWYCWKPFHEELVVSTAPRPLPDITLQLSPQLHRGNEEWPGNVVSFPDSTYERGSGDTRLIPQASLMLITWREISLRQSHCRKQNLYCNTGNSCLLQYDDTALFLAHKLVIGSQLCPRNQLDATRPEVWEQGLLVAKSGSWAIISSLMSLWGLGSWVILCM